MLLLFDFIVKTYGCFFAGETVVSRFGISAAGCLSVPVLPKIPGLEKFEGNVYHPGRWPKETVDLSGQRVGIVGTGSSSLQIVPAIATQVSELFVFQRTPNHAVPANNHPISESYSQRIKQRYDQLWKKWLSSPGFSNNTTPVSSTLDVTDEERQIVLEAQWKKGGYDLLYTYDDVLLDQSANDIIAEFARKKVREVVKDPIVAEQLVPGQHPLGSKRICIQDGYYEAFNRPNVHLVSAKVEPIEEIEPQSIRTSKGNYPIDTLICATGYDAVSGPLP
jgi:cation diffusion facilitator CzcD-associated flavoprotein CzcO